MKLLKTPDGGITPAVRQQLGEAGWSIKLQRIDKDPAKAVLGYRLTNCRALIEEAYSIQIFDHSTVTLCLSPGFKNEDHITLTGDDGREFLLWLREHPPTDEDGDPVEILPNELWQQIHDEPTPAALEMAAPVINMSKARLVEYLTKSCPQIFGKYGSMGATSEDFYTELLALVKDPARDDSIGRRMVQAFEVMAHTFYSTANACLRSAAATGKQAGRIEGYAMVLAAEECRHRADEYRNHIAGDAPKESEFPEAINADEFAQSFDHAIAAEAAAMARAWIISNAPHPDARAGAAENSRAAVKSIVCEDDVVAIIDPLSRYFRRMGKVVRIDGSLLDIALPGVPGGENQVHNFSSNQVMVLPGQREPQPKSDRPPSGSGYPWTGNEP